MYESLGPSNSEGDKFFYFFSVPDSNRKIALLERSTKRHLEAWAMKR